MIADNRKEIDIPELMLGGANMTFMREAIGEIIPGLFSCLEERGLIPRNGEDPTGKRAEKLKELFGEAGMLLIPASCAGAEWYFSADDEDYFLECRMSGPGTTPVVMYTTFERRSKDRVKKEHIERVFDALPALIAALAKKFPALQEDIDLMKRMAAKFPRGTVRSS